jgi:hypothetical protein
VLPSRTCTVLYYTILYNFHLAVLTRPRGLPWGVHLVRSLRKVIEKHLLNVRFIGKILENEALEKYVREDEPIHLTNIKKCIHHEKKRPLLPVDTSPAQSLNQLQLESKSLVSQKRNQHLCLEMTNGLQNPNPPGHRPGVRESCTLILWRSFSKLGPAACCGPYDAKTRTLRSTLPVARTHRMDILPAVGSSFTPFEPAPSAPLTPASPLAPLSLINGGAHRIELMK